MNIPEAIRDILKEELALHGFDIYISDYNIVVIRHHSFEVKIGLGDGKMVLILITGYKLLNIHAENPNLPLSDPKCFEQARDIILNWYL